MPFSVSPSTVAPLGPLAASGTGPRKVPHRIIVREDDPETPGRVLTSFTMPASQRFSNRMMVAPGGSARTVTLELQKLRSDKVWAQTASAGVTLLLAPGGGTTPVPNDPPYVPPPEPEPDIPAPSGTLIPLGQFRPMIEGAVAGTTYVPAPGIHDIGLGTPVFLTAPNVSIIGGSPAPLIRALARPNGPYIRASGATFRNLVIGGVDPGTYGDSNGSALLEVLGSPARVYDILLEDLVLNLPSGVTKQQHALYLNGEIERLTVRRVTFNGRNSAGVGFHGYHEPATPCKDIVVEDCVFNDFDDAILMWLTIANLTIRRCDFIRTSSKDIRIRTNYPVRIENCRGSKGILVESGSVIESGNNWSWAP